MVPLGSVSLVPSILHPLDRGQWTVTKNANHCKTCIEKKLGCLLRKILSYGDRLILINFVLTSLRVLMLAFLKYLKG
jgi:hypothetical protein